ncbi:MAG: hypothetical protein Athens071412_798 [Parcubacteria group bacterium Athens0714_12]|nr:MAG: hypothetical protein Athens071412_798 [Parcubacteria group bacterium Athens0714_12]
MPKETNLSRKTKTELLESYDSLLRKYEELKMASKLIQEPQNVELLAKAKDYTSENIFKSVSDLKITFTNNLNELAEKFAAESKKFSELRQAIELLKKKLEVSYNIQIAADTLENLISQHETKKRELELEIENKKRDHLREQEEYEYNAKLKQQREQNLYEEKVKTKNKQLEERELNIKNQEQEFNKLKLETEAFPQKLNREIELKEKELAIKLQSEFKIEKEMIKKDWESDKKLLEIQNQNLEDIIKKQNNEITILRQETERANKKAQEMAIKIIESSSVKTKTEEQQTK